MLHWTEDILAVDRLLSRSDGVVTVVGMLGTGKSILARQLRRYYELSGPRASIPDIVDDADGGRTATDLPEDHRAILFTRCRDRARGPVHNGQDHTRMAVTRREGRGSAQPSRIQ